MEGKVGEAGLCDLHPPVFIHLYNQAEIKPISIQVTDTHTDCSPPTLL